MFTVRAANTGELDAVMAVLEAAKGIMRTSGKVILNDMDNGHGFVVLEGETKDSHIRNLYETRVTGFYLYSFGSQL